MVKWTGEITDSGFFGTELGDGAEALDPAVIDLVDELSAQAPPGREGLIRVLLGLQHTFARVSWRVQELVADRFGLSPAQIAAVVSFYPKLSSERRGLVEVDVCTGSGCCLRGGERILRRVADAVSERRSTGSEARFAVNGERCFGVCGLGPVIRAHGRIRPIRGQRELDDQVDSLLGPDIVEEDDT
jgi:NADH:ubiquinone oxidoreductase subunit E